MLLLFIIFQQFSTSVDDSIEREITHNIQNKGKLQTMGGTGYPTGSGLGNRAEKLKVDLLRC